ncbi:hypothetical protein [uncultured Microscilla sp.]|uniref:hypothetical protein n=1 Tax=uncultured Microscilla sp. TaxID=432653 RepID=UPI00260FB831|nr:hypothetical protein [uncultured Microscilla sp.]
MEVILNESYGSVRLDAHNRIVYVYFVGRISTDEYKNIWNALLSIATEKNLRKAFIDQSKIEKASIEARAWVVAKWFPKAKKNLPADNINIGVLSSTSFFAKIGGEYIATAVKNMSKFNIKFFPTEAEGTKWLNGL